MGETVLVAAILLEVGSLPGVRLWRSQPLAARAKTGRVIRALPKGHPDITGVLRCACGCGHARPIYIECKARTKLSPEQDAWRRMLQSYGAIWIEAHSVQDVLDALPPLM